MNKKLVFSIAGSVLLLSLLFSVSCTENKRMAIPTSQIVVDSMDSRMVFLSHKDNVIPLHKNHWQYLKKEIAQGHKDSLWIGQMEDNYYTVIFEKEIPLYFIAHKDDKRVVCDTVAL